LPLGEKEEKRGKKKKGGGERKKEPARKEKAYSPHLNALATSMEGREKGRGGGGGEKMGLPKKHCPCVK